MDIEVFQQASTFLTFGVAALVTATVVEFFKLLINRWQGDEWKWKDPLVILSAFLTAIAVSYAARRANLLPVTEAIWWLIVLQSIILGALATGGYEWLSKMWDFGKNVVSVVREARNVTNITVGDIEDSTSISVGPDADSKVEK